MANITSKYNLPTISNEGGLSGYLIQIKKFCKNASFPNKE